MERDYVIVVDGGMGALIHVKGLKKALIEFRKTVQANIDLLVDLYLLVEGWTDLDADNVEGGFLIYHDPDAEDLYVAEFATDDDGIGVFAVEDLAFVNNINIPLNVYEFEGTPEDFYSGEWVCFLGDLVLSTSK